MLRAKLIAGVPGDLIGSLTGLTEGRFPVAAHARYADDPVEKMLKQRKLKFLRRIPLDPMTGKADWVIRSNLQDRESDAWDHTHVFDVRSRSTGVALDGTKYADW